MNAMFVKFAPDDYTVVIMTRAKSSAGRGDPIEPSSVYFETMTQAYRASKAAFELFRATRYS
jgi:hypothetical protein